MSKRQMNRRIFLAKSALGMSAATVPYFFSTKQSIAQTITSPNDRLNVGVIGAGGISRENMNAAKGWLDIIAIADVDRGHADAMNHDHAGNKADIYEDYSDMINRDDIDVVHVATPDHWHTKPLIEAMRCGKDIYCEKPLTLTIDEGKLIRKVQKETGQVVQVGTQQRSSRNLFLRALAIISEGRLGKIKQIQAAIGAGDSSPSVPIAEVPKNLNWDRWLGPAPKTDFRLLPKEGRHPYTNCHYDFRWWYDYSGGKLTDWGAHHVDIGTWAFKVNGQTAAPVSVSGEAEHPVEFKDGYPVEADRFNTSTKYKFVVKYEDGAEMIIRSDTDNGILITGEKGRIFVNRNRLVGKPVEELESNPLKEDSVAKIYRDMPMLAVEGDNEYWNSRQTHWANFVHCVRERQMPISDVHSHMEMLNVCHLAGICGRLGREIQWDNSTEQIVGDDQANSFLGRSYRKGYEIQS